MEDMIMKIKRTIPVIISSAIMLGMTSCEDFLTIYPSDQIVEEDFWEDKRDLNNVVSACYTQLVKNMQNLANWGELRSDNFALSTGTNNENIKNIMNANLLPTNEMFKWTELYKEINFCNKVLAHGPEVLINDESFSQGDWEPIKAEVITLRALSHFYLLRVWNEVPYVTADYNNDSQSFLIPQSTQEQVLDSIIKDLEEVKTYAMNDYGNTVWNCGRITKKAVYSLLADVYLWRASKNASPDSVAKYGTQSQEDYKKCIECCDWVINYMKEDRVKSLNKSGAVLGGVNVEDLGLEDLLIPNESSPNNKYISEKEIGAYEHIFGRGNSMESIFELQVDGTNNTNGVSGYFWSLSSKVVGTITSAEALYSGINQGPNESGSTSVYSKTDYRRWENIHYEKADQLSFPIYKYSAESSEQINGAASSMLQDNSASNFKITYDDRTSSTNSCNWIFYRLSDIYLMKAEAMSQIYTDEEKLADAFNLVRLIFKRSNPYAYATNNATAKNDSLNFKSYNTPDGIENLVMNERQREFLGEGKRWFDLVRYAQRKGSTRDMLKTYLLRKYSENSSAVSAKLNTLESLFSPIYTDEIKVNPLLHQNSVWNDKETTKKTDEQ